MTTRAKSVKTKQTMAQKWEAIIAAAVLLESNYIGDGNLMQEAFEEARYAAVRADETADGEIFVYFDGSRFDPCK